MKERILAAAEAVLAETGTQFTMDTLAARLNISKRTLYEHFSSKEELVEDLLLAKARDWSDLYRAVLASDGDLPTKLTRYFTAQTRVYPLIRGELAWKLVASYPQVRAQLERLGEEDRRALKEYLHVCARQGELAEEDVEVFFFVLHGTFLESMCLHLGHGDEAAHEELMKGAIRMLWQGAAPKTEED
ncbi:MAG: TetR/AcrR family transcriptional regulator [Veillonellaceae bacterium]|nr:TetR/AcrR family transcriptional regulator [Veillonellaceae bacterium]